MSVFFSSVLYFLPNQRAFATEDDRIRLLLHCTRCHSEKLVDQQHLTRADWDKTLLWMEDKHKLTFPSQVIRENILNYLEKNHGPLTKKNPSPMGLRPVNPLPK